MGKHISDIIEIDRLQLLMEKFTAATGTGTAILDMEANILVASGWQDICSKFHRTHPESCKNCLKSDRALASDLEKGKTYNLYQCLNGLVDVAMPILVKEKHIGNLFIGQFLLQKPDLDFFAQQAKKFGFDEKEYLAALSKVAIISEEEVKKKIEFLAELAVLIGDIGINRFEVESLALDQEQKIEARTNDYKQAQLATLNMMQDADEARKEAETSNEKLKEAMLNLKHSNKELEQFAYIASHDLQEPLRMVASYTQLLERRYKDKLDDDAREFIFFAVDGANRMQRLINDLLDYSRVTTRGKPMESLDLNSVLGLAIANLKHKIQETGAMVSNEVLPQCHGDETQLARVFQNLIDNAIKFQGDTDPRIHISAKEEGDKIVISVKDNGIGIEQKYQDRIFTIFQRLHSKSEYPGTGIGLAICKRTIERHGGNIRFKNNGGEDKGTTFYFSLHK